MHPWAAYLISQDYLAREERRRRAETRAPSRHARARGCAL